MHRFVSEWTPIPDELAWQTDASIDRFLALLEDATDADMVFTPDVPDVLDICGGPVDREIAWTVANVVHAIASGEEYAVDATRLVRGVDFPGRLRFETP